MSVQVYGPEAPPRPWRVAPHLLTAEGRALWRGLVRCVPLAWHPAASERLRCVVSGEQSYLTHVTGTGSKPTDEMEVGGKFVRFVTSADGYCYEETEHNPLVDATLLPMGGDPRAMWFYGDPGSSTGPILAWGSDHGGDTGSSSNIQISGTNGVLRWGAFGGFANGSSDNRNRTGSYAITFDGTNVEDSQLWIDAEPEAWDSTSSVAIDTGYFDLARSEDNIRSLSIGGQYRTDQGADYGVTDCNLGIVAVWNRPLTQRELRVLHEDPYILIRPDPYAVFGLSIIVPSLDGFRFRNDDGTEVTATWLASEDTGATVDTDSTFRVRVQADNIEDGKTYRLVTRKSGETVWKAIE